MSPIVKWIGGATLLLLVLFGTAATAAHFLTAPAARDVQAATLQAQPVLEKGPVQAAFPAQAALDSQFVIKRILPIDGPIKYGEWHWDEDDVPAGPLVITVDLEARVISVFRDGYEIGAAAVLLGTDDYPTPLGVFPILEKKKDNISSIYNVPMPYTLRLTWDGISIHSSEVENGFASHGCVGTPDGFAAKLFALASVGDKVIVTRGETAGIGSSLATD